MLFVISLSLLIGVVKVRAWLGEGEGGQDVGWGGGWKAAQLPSCPKFPPARWAALAAEGAGGGYFGKPHLHPRDLQAHLLQCLVATPDSLGQRPGFPVKMSLPGVGRGGCTVGRRGSWTL